MEYESISKGLIGRLALLRHKKQRDAQGLFVAEGTKCVSDTLPYFQPVYIVATEHWIDSNPGQGGTRILRASKAEMERISSLATVPEVIAIYRKPTWEIDRNRLTTDLTLMLDDVQDPGNLGTIIRLADWFGVHQILASRGTADVFSTKAIQATMGSISRVKIFYVDLESVIAEYPQIPVAGLLLDGSDIYSAKLPTTTFIIMGNEGNGISPRLRQFISQRLLIPSYPPGQPTGESLNVAMATAITLSEFRRPR